MNTNIEDSIEGHMNDPLHIATHEAGHAVIARVLTLACGGASIQPDYDAGGAGHSIIADPLVTASVWDRRWKFRNDGAVYRARIIAYMAGTEAEAELLGAAQGGDGDDRYQIDMMAEQLDRYDLDRLRAMTRMLVRRHRHRIEGVAATLLTERKLSGRADRPAGRAQHRRRAGSHAARLAGNSYGVVTMASTRHQSLFQPSPPITFRPLGVMWPTRDGESETGLQLIGALIFAPKSV